MARRARVTVDATQREPLRRIWRYVGYDEVNYTYTTLGCELLGKLGQLNDAPYYMRAHYLLCSGDGTGKPKWGSTNVYTEDDQSQPVYHWELIDRVFDAYVDNGCLPFVELGFMPEALTTAPSGTPYDALRDGGWRYPPVDYGKWQSLVAELARHCLERYGLRQVSQWYWELWNEPDIFYFEGSVQEYCRLYDHTVAGLASVLPQARVGGPGTTNPPREEAGAFLERFLQHCVSGTNSVTGEMGTRLDFCSFHTKGGGYRPAEAAPKQTPTIHRLVNNVVVGLDILGRFPTLAGREVILTEADPDGMAAYGKYENDNLRFRNWAYYASYLGTAICKLGDLGVDGPNRVDGLLTWAFQFEGREYFEGLRTLSTNGIDKPVLNVFRLMARLGGARLHLESDAARPPQAILAADEPGSRPEISGLAALNGQGGIQVLLVSHHDDWDVTDPTQVTLSAEGLQGERHHLKRTVIDGLHSNSHTLWRRMGEPQRPTADQLCALKRAGMPETVEERDLYSREGRASLSLGMAAHSVCLLELEPKA